MKVGFIGLGYWGPNLVRNFFKHPDITVSSVCDLDLRRCEKTQQIINQVALANIEQGTPIQWSILSK